MTNKIGFSLVTHSAPAQIVRLVRRLDAMFDHPPVACHHDFSQCGLPLEQFGANVSFVQSYVRTRWASVSTIIATEKTLRLMYGEVEGPDWCVLLSGADYPIKPAARILEELNAGGFDAHIHYELIDPHKFERTWQELCYRRYFGRRVWLPSLTRRLRFKWRETVLPPWLVSGLAPFSKDLRCYAGSNWFCLNRRAAKHFLAQFHEYEPLRVHGEHVWCPDEFYFQTILVNAKPLKLHNDNYRFAEESKDGVFPRILGLDDVSMLLASPCHFARKFAPDRPDVLVAIDLAVDNLARQDGASHPAAR